MTLSLGSQRRAAGTLELNVSPTRLRLTSQLREWLAAAWRHLLGARALPADLRTQLALRRGERVLSVQHDPGGDYALVASDLALYHRGRGHGWSRLGWEQITRVRWDPAAGQVLISGLDSLAPLRTAVSLRKRGTLPELAQERITHTRLGRWHLHLAGNRSVLVEVRLRPGTGELVWAVISASDRLDSVGADATAEIARAVARFGEHLGVCDPPSWKPATAPLRARIGGATVPASAQPGSVRIGHGQRAGAIPDEHAGEPRRSGMFPDDKAAGEPGGAGNRSGHDS